MKRRSASTVGPGRWRTGRCRLGGSPDHRSRGPASRGATCRGQDDPIALLIGANRSPISPGGKSGHQPRNCSSTSSVLTRQARRGICPRPRPTSAVQRKSACDASVASSTVHFRIASCPARRTCSQGSGWRTFSARRNSTYIPSMDHDARSEPSWQAEWPARNRPRRSLPPPARRPTTWVEQRTIKPIDRRATQQHLAALTWTTSLRCMACRPIGPSTWVPEAPPNTGAG